MRLNLPAALTTTRVMLMLDVAAIATSWPAILATGLVVPRSAPGVQFLVLAVAYPLTAVAVLYALGMYRRDSLIEARRSLSRIPFVAALSAVGGSLLAVLLTAPLRSQSDQLPDLGPVLLAAFGCMLACGMATRILFRLLRRRGVIRRRLLVVGAGRRAWDLVWMLRAEGQNLNYKIVFAHKPVLGEIDPRLLNGSEGEVVCATEPGLLQTAQDFEVDQIVVAPDERRGMTLTDLLACKTAGFPIKQYLNFVEAETRRIDLKRMEVGWLLYSDGFYFGVIDRCLKRMLDILVCCVLLVPATPLLLIAMAAIKLDDGGPVFYRQVRVSRGSRGFDIIKLRTMAVDAESSGAVWAASKDSRITRIGNTLRRTRLDELPQLFNVIRGDMSLVGPRPERPGFVSMLAKEIPLYNERHLVKAGLTGWAQINYPYGASINDARSKLSYDLYYIKNFSIIFDLFIILQTLRVVLWPGTSVR